MTLVTNDIEVPADTADGTVDLRLTNRIAVLLAAVHEVTATRAERFAAAVPIPLEGVDLSLRRGYAAADLAVGERPVTVATTHLDSFVAGIRDAQVRNSSRLFPPTDRWSSPAISTPVPGRAPKRTTASGPNSTTPTPPCDRTRRATPAAMTTTSGTRPASLTRRVDAVLHRGRGRPTGIARVGDTTDERVRADVGGESVRVWPSDHAGLVASLTVPAAAGRATTGRSPTATSSPTASSTPTSRTTETSADTEPQDRFGIVGVVLAGAGSVLSALRRRSGGDTE